MAILLLLTACLVNSKLYEERAAELADADGDGWRPVDGDCDDADADRHPENPERCDGQDQDCDGEIDEGPPEDAPTWYPDLDGDGHGDTAGAVVACAAPAGFVDHGGDCADDDATVNPEAEEVCDGQDQDCDGEIDEGASTDAPTWYEDRDGDGYGDASRAAVACQAPAGFVERAGDCDDGEASVNPGATEVCGNGVDDNCNEDITECRWEGTSLADQHVARWEGEGSALTSFLMMDPLPGDPDGLVSLGFREDRSCIVGVWPLTVEGSPNLADAMAQVEDSQNSCGYSMIDLLDLDDDGYRDLAMTSGTTGLYFMSGPLRGETNIHDSGSLLISFDDDATALDQPGDLRAARLLTTTSLAISFPWAGSPQVRLFEIRAASRDGVGDFDARITSTSEDGRFGWAIAWSDDNGDGIPDLFVTDPLDSTRVGGIFHGPLVGDWDGSDANRLLSRTSADLFVGFHVTGGADLDGDGHEDWLVTYPLRTGDAPSSGMAFLVPGGGAAALRSDDLSTRLVGTVEDQGLGFQAVLVDLDKDGASDALFSSVGYGGPVGTLYGPFSPGTQPVSAVLTAPTGTFARVVSYPSQASLDDRVVVGSLQGPFETSDERSFLLFHHLQP